MKYERNIKLLQTPYKFSHIQGEHCVHKKGGDNSYSTKYIYINLVFLPSSKGGDCWLNELSWPMII